MTARRLATTVAAGVFLSAALAAVPARASAKAGAPAAKGGIAVVGWGVNADGQLGNNTTTNSSKPVFAELLASIRYTTVRTGQSSLALTSSGRVWGWGDNTFGQLGDGTKTMRLRPVRASKLSGVKVTALRGGGQFSVALTSTGKVLAWGNNAFGQLGDGTAANRLKPVRVKIPRGVQITAISTGYNSALALTKSGRVLAWGGNAIGQLGDGTTKDRHAPRYVRLPPHAKITSIAAGYATGYAVTSAGGLLAWGYNFDGGLGDGTTTTRLKPVQVRLPHGVKVAAATAGFGQALALTTGGRALAWGSNMSGQLGNGSTADRHSPVFVKLPAGTRVRGLAAGEDFGMALTTTGRVLAWGANIVGQLGNGTTTDSATPVRVHLPAGFRTTGIGAGWSAESGLAIGNAPLAGTRRAATHDAAARSGVAPLRARGLGGSGQLGNGDLISRYLPTAVHPPGGLVATAVFSGPGVADAFALVRRT